MSTIRKFVNINELFGCRVAAVAVRIHADDLFQARCMLHELGWVFVSGKSLLSNHIDDSYRRGEERGKKPYITLGEDGRVGRIFGSGYDRDFVRQYPTYSYDELVEAYQRVKYGIHIELLDLPSIYNSNEA